MQNPSPPLQACYIPTITSNSTAFNMAHTTSLPNKMPEASTLSEHWTNIPLQFQPAMLSGLASKAKQISLPKPHSQETSYNSYLDRELFLDDLIDQQQAHPLPQDSHQLSITQQNLTSVHQNPGNVRGSPIGQHSFAAVQQPVLQIPQKRNFSHGGDTESATPDFTRQDLNEF